MRCFVTFITAVYYFCLRGNGLRIRVILMCSWYYYSGFTGVNIPVFLCSRVPPFLLLVQTIPTLGSTISCSFVIPGSLPVADLGEGPGGPAPRYFRQKKKKWLKGKRPAGQENQDRPPPPPFLSSRSGSTTACPTTRLDHQATHCISDQSQPSLL